MLTKLKPKSEFTKNVLTLMTGTTVAQAIPIAISPILTRIYTPEDFGLFSLYIGLSSIVSIAATAKYEAAIVLPKKEKDAINIAVLAILIASIISLILLLIIVIFNTFITTLLGNSKISIFLYLIPLSVLLTGIYQSMYYWMNRQKKYKELANNRIIQSGTTVSTNLFLGYFGSGVIGLIGGNILGLFIGSIILGKDNYKNNIRILNEINKKKLYEVTYRYIDFPKYDMPASLANTASQQIPNLLFNTLFGASTAGYYYLTQRILQVPIIFVGRAFLDVFKEKASKEFLEYGNARDIYLSTIYKLILIGFIPSIVFYFYAIDLFILIFGEKWKIAGEYAQVLSPMLFLRFVSSPLSFMFYIGEKQKLNLILQIILLCTILLSFLIFKEAADIVFSISISFSIFYLCQIILSGLIAKIF